MKTFAAAHWEKLVFCVAFLLCAASAVVNLVLGGFPPCVDETNRHIQALQARLRRDDSAPLPECASARELQVRLSEHPGTFEMKSDLLNYGGTVEENVRTLTEGESQVYAVAEAYNKIEYRSDSDKEIARVEPVHNEPTRVKITALRKGVLTVELKNEAKPVGMLKIMVREKDRFELWPPVLLGVQPSPVDPGEVTITWRDHYNTASGVTLGYVIEHRPPGGAFTPVLGPGKMLKATEHGYVDIVEPNHQYEYRVLAIGNPSVTHLMEEKP